MKLKNLRMSRKLGVTAVSRKCNLTRERIYQIERGQSQIPILVLKSMSQLYGVGVEELVNLNREDMLERVREQKRSLLLKLDRINKVLKKDDINYEQGAMENESDNIKRKRTC